MIYGLCLLTTQPPPEMLSEWVLATTSRHKTAETTTRCSISARMTSFWLIRPRSSGELRKSQHSVCLAMLGLDTRPGFSIIRTIRCICSQVTRVTPPNQVEPQQAQWFQKPNHSPPVCVIDYSIEQIAPKSTPNNRSIRPTSHHGWNERHHHHLSPRVFSRWPKKRLIRLKSQEPRF